MKVRCLQFVCDGADRPLLVGFILDKTIAVNSPKRLENAKILIANTSMDTDKIKIFGARVKVDGTGKLAELERAEKVWNSSLIECLLTDGAI